MTPEGGLVTDEGYPLAWSRSSSPIDPVGDPIAIDGEGTVRQGSLEIGVLRLVNFAHHGSLRQDSKGFWVAPRGLAEATHTAVVHQGALEQSNANGMDELVEMIAVQRSFESAASVMSSVEESYRRLTRPF